MSSKRRVGIAHFLLRTFEMLETPKLKHLIEWSPDGEYFVIKNSREFANKVLPQYFRHKNFQSFLRQLNMYNFVKKRLKNGWNQFQHKYFKRDAKNLLVQVHRRSNGQCSEDEEQQDSQDLLQKQQEQLQSLKYLQNDITISSHFLYQQSIVLLESFQSLKNKLLYQYLEEQKQEQFLNSVFSRLHKQTIDSPRLSETIRAQLPKQMEQEPQIFVLS